MNKFTSTIAGASIFIAFFGFLSKGIGFLREILFASIFGLSAEFDVYLVGAVIPLTINTIILCLGQNYVIPVFNDLSDKDPKGAIKFIQSTLILFFIGGVVLSALLFLFSDLIASSYILTNDNALIETTKDIFKLFLLTIPITSLVSVIIAYQQSRFEFRYSVLSNIILNILILIMVFSLRSINIFAIPIGYVSGSLLQLFYLTYKSKELLMFSGLFSENINYSKMITLPLMVIILIESIGQLYMITDRYFFNMVTLGGISALNYAQTIYLLPISILSIALSTAIFPKFSEYFNKKMYTDLERIFNEGLRVCIVIFMPIMFLFIYQGEFILRIIFERGKFSAADTLVTSEVLFYYSLSIVFYAAYGILNKIIYSTGLIKKLLLITILGIGLKVILNIKLVENLAQNGLALSTSISYTFFFVTAYILVFRTLRFKSKTIFFNEFLFHLINCFICINIAGYISSLFNISPIFAVVEIVLFLGLYLVNLYSLENVSLNILFRFLKNTNFIR